MNWLKCPRCSFVYVNLGINVTPWVRKRAGPGNQCHCGAGLQMLLVTPSYVRDVRDPNLLSIWQHAYESLRTADEWIFVGYSLPAEDVAIRTMLLRSYLGHPGGQRPAVSVHDPSPEVRARFQAQFPGSRPNEQGIEGLLTGR